MNPMMKTPVLEVCCGRWADVVAAVAGGAERIELCSALPLDGLTPSAGLLRQVHKAFPDLRIHVLIRPREGDFVYTEAEVCAMEADIRDAAACGATAIVGGALTPEGRIDMAVTRRLVQASGALPFTFHRAFDQVADQVEALRELARLGVRRVLTSGGAPSAEAGIAALRRLVQASQAEGSPQILPGGGVNSRNAARILHETGATEIHGSCSERLPDGARHTQPDEVRAVLAALAPLRA